MKTVTILGYEDALSSAITGIYDIFSMVGVAWQRVQGESIDPKFKVQIASLDGAPVQCANNILLNAHCSIQEIEFSDLLFVPTMVGRIETTLKDCKPLYPWIRQLHSHGCDIASNDTGAFLVAESGVLNDHCATTHWGFTDVFRQRYPEVTLQSAQMITADDQVFCSGGGMAWIDLSIFLIERYYGHEISKQIAKMFVVDTGRKDQSAYGAIPTKKYHQDPDVLRIQEWLETHYDKRINLDELAAHFALSSRTFKRRFKNATHDTPLQYLQKVRIDEAKRHLENTRKPIDTIASLVGYHDQSAFSKLFKRETGFTPGEYRLRFHRH